MRTTNSQITITKPKKIDIILHIFIILILASCGTKEVRKVSEESKLAQEAFALAEILKNAYIENDREALEENTTPNGYRELTRAMKQFDHAELSFAPTWVEIEDSTVSLTVSWKGKWKTSGKTTEDRGSAVFILEGKPLKLSQVQRENPFSRP